MKLQVVFFECICSKIFWMDVHVFIRSTGARVRLDGKGVLLLFHDLYQIKEYTMNLHVSRIDAGETKQVGKSGSRRDSMVNIIYSTYMQVGKKSNTIFLND